MAPPLNENETTLGSLVKRYGNLILRKEGLMPNEPKLNDQEKEELALLKIKWICSED